MAALTILLLMPKGHAAILARYDGALVAKDQGAAHLAANQTRAPSQRIPQA